ncbi:MAG: tetratricopeptide repeat protein [Planctomycetes bacterium]|nr:tetratricopeptide repeat protein [Planctomycetota bacterium]
MNQTARLCLFLLIPLMGGGCTSLLGDKVADSKAKKREAEKPTPQETALRAPAPRISPNTHLVAGQMLERQGDFAGAVEQYEKVVIADPRQPEGYNRIGIVYQKMNRFADADQIFRKGLVAAPGSAMLHNNLGFNFLQQKQFEEAEKSFRDALALSPQFKRARMNLGIVLAHQGRFDDGVGEFAKVVPVDVAHFNVAAVAMQTGNFPQCEKSLRQALSINPNCPGAKEQLQRVTRLAASTPSKTPTQPMKPLSPLAGNAGQETGSP